MSRLAYGFPGETAGPLSPPVMAWLRLLRFSPPSCFSCPWHDEHFSANSGRIFASKNSIEALSSTEDACDFCSGPDKDSQKFRRNRPKTLTLLCLHLTDHEMRIDRPKIVQFARHIRLRTSRQLAKSRDISSNRACSTDRTGADG